MESKVKNVISDSKKIASDNELINDLSDFNIEQLINKSTKGRSIWLDSFKKSYSDNEKKARRLIRNEQLKLSKSLIHAILTKNDYLQSAKNLHEFYKKGLCDFSVYSNISENESPDKFKIVHTAYAKMKLILTIK